MAMWPFNRRNKGGDSNLPTEVQDYYQAERRDRTGVAWLLALGTLVVTILLALGLFFGGRWVYRQVADNDEPDRTARNGQETQSPQEGRDEASQPESSTTPPSTPNTQTTPSPNTPTTPQPGASSQGTGTASDLPNTGPTEVISVFLLTMAIGTVLYQIRLRRAAIK